jgi:hypothetical protein
VPIGVRGLIGLWVMYILYFVNIYDMSEDIYIYMIRKRVEYYSPKCLQCEDLYIDYGLYRFY